MAITATYRDLIHGITIGSGLGSRVGSSIRVSGGGILIVNRKVIHHLRIELFSRLLTVGRVTSLARTCATTATSGSGLRSSGWLRLGLRLAVQQQLEQSTSEDRKQLTQCVR